MKPWLSSSLISKETNTWISSLPGFLLHLASIRWFIQMPRWGQGSLRRQPPQFWTFRTPWSKSYWVQRLPVSYTGRDPEGSSGLKRTCKWLHLSSVYPVGFPQFYNRHVTLWPPTCPEVSSAFILTGNTTKMLRRGGSGTLGSLILVSQTEGNRDLKLWSEQTSFLYTASSIEYLVIATKTDLIGSTVF